MTNDKLSVSFQTLGYFFSGREHTDYQVGVLRIHPEGGDYFRSSPYSWAATLSIEGDKSWIHGAIKTVKPSEYRALRKYLRTLGLSTVQWERHNGKDTTVTVLLRHKNGK